MDSEREKKQNHRSFRSSYSSRRGDPSLASGWSSLSGVVCTGSCSLGRTTRGLARSNALTNGEVTEEVDSPVSFENMATRKGRTVDFCLRDESVRFSPRQGRMVRNSIRGRESLEH